MGKQCIAIYGRVLGLEYKSQALLIKRKWSGVLTRLSEIANVWAVCASWRHFEFSWISTLFVGFFTVAWVSWDGVVLDFLQ